MADLMMEVPLSDGRRVVVEVDRREVAVCAIETLERPLDKVRPTLHSLSKSANSAGPDECCVEFGLKLGGELGVIVAKGTAEVHFAVKLTWWK